MTAQNLILIFLGLATKSSLESISSYPLLTSQMNGGELRIFLAKLILWLGQKAAIMFLWTRAVMAKSFSGIMKSLRKLPNLATILTPFFRAWNHLMSKQSK